VAWSVEAPPAIPQLSSWVRAFRRGGHAQRRVAAFLLALVANLEVEPAALRPLLPLRDKVLCREVTNHLARLVAHGLLERGQVERLPELFAFDPVDAETHIPRWCAEALRRLSAIDTTPSGTATGNTR
jgi:hypothetical protein